MNRDEFFAFADVTIEKVHIKEMNTDFYVRSLSAAEKSKWELDAIEVSHNPKQNDAPTKIMKSRMETAQARLVELAVCHEDGSRFFKDGDAAAIGRKNAMIVAKLFNVAARLSAITKEDLEEITKNSEANMDDGSTLA